MCGNIFFVLVVSGMSLEMVTGSEVGYTQKKMNLLCSVFTSAKSVLETSEESGPLTEAIYGKKNENAQFVGGGAVEFGLWCSKKQNGRGPLCTYYTGGSNLPGNFGKSGCFAGSLVGTFMCLCIPGVGSSNNTCGVDNWDGDTWSGNWDKEEQKIDRKAALFKKVWQNVIEKCHDKNKIVDESKDKRESLLEALKAVRAEIQSRKRGNFFFLGDEEGNECNGLKGTDICARYQVKNDKPDIPWADKIEKAVEEHIEKKKKATLLDRTQSSPQTQGEPEAGVVRVVHDEALEVAPQAPITLEKDEKPENRETETHEIQSPENFTVEASKRSKKRSTQRSHKIPHIATDPNEDGSLLNSPMSLLLVAFLN